MKRTSGRILLAGTASAIVFGFAGSAHAQAFYLQEQSVRAQGRAFSGEAADTGVDSLWWNPAAIGGLEGGQASVHASVILPRGKVVDDGTVIVRPGQAPAPVGGNGVAKNPINNGVLPSGSIAYGTGKFAFGLTVTSPYSFTTDYDSDSWARYSADKTKLRTIDIQPSVAFQPFEGFYVGAAANVEYVDAALGNYLPNLSPTLADGHQNLKGNGWDVGWSVGAQYHNGPASIGVAYKSAVKHKLKGTLTIDGLLGPLAAQNRTLDATAEFSTPWQAIMSGRIKATKQLTLNAQVVAYGWSKFDSIDLGAPINQSLPENYKDGFSYAFGVDYDVNPKWTVRSGIQYGETPTSNGNRDARVPDSNRWNFSAGTTYNMSEKIAIDAAASYITFKDAPVDRLTAAYAGTAAQTPVITNGRLTDASALVFSLGARVAF
ncbi:MULTISPECIES: OmpP1/FadL family transporter [Novosphingobium]|uniref:Aromatic hydrocarbon degradation protein n=1 Tax=Novosphingobium pentaromativorans TaxID=205844 RepID=A0A2W5QFX9_9SPHN|nr:MULTISPECIES: outer membrane protein transport protein [Novosphingobium]PZQ56537.1 MAG: aromatic hydrocarbon degradation protein [Novosphingobium pentaromativorans]GFE74494.1 long-chain fatty acid transporter [Novosphingobium sp. TCA1]